MSEAETKAYLGATTLRYLHINNMITDGFCTGCFTGEYPT